MKFGMITHTVTLFTLSADKISNFYPTWPTAAILTNRKSPYLCNGLADRHKILHDQRTLIL